MDVDGILQAASMMLGPERAAASAVAVASGQQQKMSSEAPRKDTSTGNAPALPATAHDQPGSVAAVPSASEPARKRRKLVEIRPREDHNAGDKTRNASSGGAAPKAAAATASVNTDQELLSAAALYAKIRQPDLSQNGFDPLQPSALVHVHDRHAADSAAANRSIASASSSHARSQSQAASVAHGGGVDSLEISNIQGIGEVSIIRRDPPAAVASANSNDSSSSSSSSSEPGAPGNKSAGTKSVSVLPAPTSLRLAVACEMQGKFATPRQIPIDYSATHIPFGNVRHEVLQETGEHVLYISISPPGGVKYWMQISGFVPNRSTVVPPNVSQVIPEPVIVSSKNEVDLSRVATQTRWQRHGKTVTDIIAAVVAKAAAAGISINPNPPCVQTQGMAELPQGLQIPATNVCDVCAVSLSASSDSVSTCASCCRSVHHACYGIPFGVSTNSSWQCDSCVENQTVFGGTPVPCVFCSKTDGMMKKTSDGNRWAHLLCAVYLPRAAFHLPYSAEGIGAVDEYGTHSGVETAVAFHACKQGQKCTVCGRTDGAVAVCAARLCTAVFHPRCAFDNGHLMFCKGEERESMRAEFVCFCKHHSDLAAKKSIEDHVSGHNLLLRSDQVQRKPKSIPYQGVYGQVIRVEAECARSNGIAYPYDRARHVSFVGRSGSGYGGSSSIFMRKRKKQDSGAKEKNSGSAQTLRKILEGGTSCKESIESASMPMQLFLTKPATDIDSTTDFADSTLRARFRERNWHGEHIAGIKFLSAVSEVSFKTGSDARVNIQGKLHEGDDTKARVNGVIVQSKRKALEMIHHKLVPSFDENENIALDEREQFMRDLRMFHDIVGTTMRQYGKDIAVMKRLPRLAYKEVDLFLVMKYAVSYGGYRHLTQVDGGWAKIFRSLPNWSSSETSASFRLRKIYERYLRFFEAHFYPHLAAGHTPNRCYKQLLIGKKKKKKKKKKSESPQFNNVANANVDLARAPDWAVSTSKPNKQANSGVEGHALFSGFNKAGESDAKSKSFEGSDGLFKVKDKRVVSFGERFGSGAGTKSDNILNSNSKTELSNNEVDDQKKKKKKKKRKRTRTKKGADKQETETEMFGGFVFSASSAAK